MTFWTCLTYFRFQLQDDFQLSFRIRFTPDLGLADRFNSLLFPVVAFDLRDYTHGKLNLQDTIYIFDMYQISR